MHGRWPHAVPDVRLLKLENTWSIFSAKLLFLDMYFSNSLIIRQVKTKEITTVKEVLIPGLN